MLLQISGFTLQVQDLHAVTPASFLEASGSVIHSLSYQQARNSRMAVGQVYLAEAGYLMGQAGQPHGCVCTRTPFGTVCSCMCCHLCVALAVTSDACETVCTCSWCWCC